MKIYNSQIDKILSGDAHVGFYDHVQPPAAVLSGDLVSAGNVHHNFAFDRMGIRAPSNIASPLIKKGVIDHTVYDHTSLVATTERLLGMTNLTKRDKNAYDFLHLLSLDKQEQIHRPFYHQ